MTDLKDTTDMMISDDYKERFYAEYWQLKIRYEKIKHLNSQMEASQITGRKYLKFNPTCPYDLLKRQEKAMAEYLNCMEVRAVIENIDLTDDL